MEVLPTPFSSILASVPIEDGEKALSLDAAKIGNKRMTILHCTTGAFVVGDAHLVSFVLFAMPVQDLRRNLVRLRVMT